MIHWEHGDKCYEQNPKAVCTFLTSSTDGKTAVVEFDCNCEILTIPISALKPVPTVEDLMHKELTDFFEEISTSVRYMVGGNELVASELLALGYRKIPDFKGEQKPICGLKLD